jgi:hypothetical protein
MPCEVEAKGTEMVLPLSSASDCTFESFGTTMPLPLPVVLPESTVMKMLLRPAFWKAAPLKLPGKSAIEPRSSLPATISLVSGAPEVKFFHSIWYCASLYLPVRGRYFSSSFNSRIRRPPVAQLMVVSCVPMAMRMVSACAVRTVGNASSRPRVAPHRDRILWVFIVMLRVEMRAPRLSAAGRGCRQ